MHQYLDRTKEMWEKYEENWRKFWRKITEIK